MDVATRLIDSITGRFSFLAAFPYVGRTRDEDFGAGSRHPEDENVRTFDAIDNDVLAHGEAATQAPARFTEGSPVPGAPRR